MWYYKIFKTTQECRNSKMSDDSGVQEAQQSVAEVIIAAKTGQDMRKHRKRAPRMLKVGLAVPQETLVKLHQMAELRGASNINELIRHYISKCLMEDEKTFTNLAAVGAQALAKGENL